MGNSAAELLPMLDASLGILFTIWQQFDIGSSLQGRKTKGKSDGQKYFAASDAFEANLEESPE